jgi:Holliday junction resolvasome RuvABC endonuclease subunit
MHKKPVTILGINPGTKYMAVALFRESDLREWSVKVFKGKWSTEKMKKIITVIDEIISRYGVTSLAVKKLHPARTSRQLNLLVKKMKDMAKRRKLKVREYSIKQLEQSLCPGEKGNKKKLAEKVVRDYHILSRELEKERTHRNAYYIRLFEAVALGMMNIKT